MSLRMHTSHWGLQALQPEGDRPDDVAGLAADARQRIELVDVARDLAAEPLLDYPRHEDQALGLRAEEARSVDELLDLVGIGVREVGRSRVPLEDRRRDLVDGLVGRLC